LINHPRVQVEPGVTARQDYLSHPKSIYRESKRDFKQLFRGVKRDRISAHNPRRLNAAVGMNHQFHLDRSANILDWFWLQLLHPVKP
jgi:hypothetical protein